MIASRRPSVRTVSLGLACVGVAAPVVRHRLRLSTTIVSVLAWQAPVCVAFAFPRSRVRDAAIYALQMWAYIAHYEMPNDRPEILLARLRVDYPIKVDRLLGFGRIPTVRLQRALGRPGQIRTHDVALSWVHWIWFITPHLTLGYILMRHRRQFLRSALSMAAVFDMGLVFYWRYPTAPPWWAAHNANMPPVRRIMAEAGEKYWRQLWTPLYDSLSGNPFAAMPSLHFATSVMGAHLLGDVSPAAGRIGWAYAGALGFALVYLGEHYVIDLIAGGALAEGIRASAPQAALAASALAGQLDAARSLRTR